MFFPLPVRLSLDFRSVRRMVLVDVLFVAPSISIYSPIRPKGEKNAEK